MSRELLRFAGFTPDRFRRDPRLVPAGTVQLVAWPLRIVQIRACFTMPGTSGTSHLR